MKLSILSVFCTASLLLLNGCTPSSPKPADVINVDVSLQKIELTKNGVFSDMKSIAFEYKPITDTRVKGVYVYRISNDALDGDEYFDTIDNRFATHYVDSKVQPGHSYKYYFKTFSDEAESQSSDIVLVDTLPAIDSVSWIHSINSMPRTAKIIWRPHTSKEVVAYIVERKTLEKDEWEQIATVKGRLSAEFIDKELKDNYIYSYRIRVKTFNKIVSNPSEEVKVITKPLPLGVGNLIATTNLPKTIALNWDNSSAEDFGLYYLYRAETPQGHLELIAKLHNNNFIDKIDEDGKEYFYKVSVVDKDGLESLHQNYAVQGATLSIPKTPYVTKAAYINGKVELAWYVTDSRAEKYFITKNYKKGWFDVFKDEFDGVIGGTLSDAAVESGVIYHYQIVSIDKYGLRSLPSIDVEVRIPVELNQADNLEVQTKEVQVEEYNAPKTQDLNVENQDIITPVENMDISEN